MTEIVSNGVIGNGHAVQPEPQQPSSEFMQRIRSFILTIYDIIVFLAVSIGYISEVSVFVYLLPSSFSRSISLLNIFEDDLSLSYQ